MLNNPVGVTFQWFMGTTQLANNQAHISDVTTDTLSINSAPVSLSGEYSVQLNRTTPEMCTSESPATTLVVCECFVECIIIVACRMIKHNSTFQFIRLALHVHVCVYC